MAKCKIGIRRYFHLGKVVTCIWGTLQPPSRRFLSLRSSNWKWQATQAEVSLLLSIRSHTAPLRAVSLIKYQQDLGGVGGGTAGDRPLNMMSVLLPHVCQYTPVPKASTKPICVSPSLSCWPPEIQPRLPPLSLSNNPSFSKFSDSEYFSHFQNFNLTIFNYYYNLKNGVLFSV